MLLFRIIRNDTGGKIFLSILLAVTVLVWCIFRLRRLYDGYVSYEADW